MTKASRKRQHKTPVAPDVQTAHAEIATVASLGVQARLVPADPEREREVACLIARYERVCREWDRLAQQALALLGPDVQRDRSEERCSARKPAG